VQILVLISLKLTHLDMTRRQHKLWGWEAFFDNLKSFIEDTDRHLGNCTERYTCYAAKCALLGHYKKLIQLIFPLLQYTLA